MQALTSTMAEQSTIMKSEIKLYAETGTVDSYMYYYFLNDEQNFGNMFTMAIGAIYQF